MQKETETETVTEKHDRRVRAKRLQQELTRQTTLLVDCNYKLAMCGDKMDEFLGELIGPQNTPYEGGSFQMKFYLPNDYPFSTPKIKFVTKIWHPNISFETGDICDGAIEEAWTPNAFLGSTMLAIDVMLSNPHPEEPQDTLIGSQYINDYETFEKTAKHWSSVYANGPYIIEECEQKTIELLDLGYDEEIVRVVLSQENWNVDEAKKILLSRRTQE